MLRAVLLLFDIDGTLLLRAAEAHKEAMHEALRRVHGVRDLGAARFEAAGRTDGEIARLILLACDVTAERIDARADDVRVAACAAYARRVPPDLSRHVAPGIPPLLEELAAREDVLLSLVTGNFEPIARLKLRSAGLGSYFASGQGGFGSDSEDRTDLPGIARHRAGAGAAPWPPRRTVVIGDTPRDIACARADGVRAVGLATGPYGPEALAAADAVARDTRELRAVIARMLERAER